MSESARTEDRLILFLFEARDEARGVEVRGSWWAHSQEQARFWLRNQGYSEVRLTPRSTGATELRTHPAALAIFYRQVAVMFGAGVPLRDALRLASFSEDRNLGGVGLLLYDLLGSGHSLSGAMRTFPCVFDAATVGLVAAAESSGRLSAVLGRLADVAERRHRLRASLLSALTYPAILLGATGVMAILFALYIFPLNQSVLATLNVAQPFALRFFALLMRQAQSPVLPVLLLALGGGSVVLGRSGRLVERTGATLSRVALWHPALSELVAKARGLRLLELLALILDSGGTLDQSLRLMIEAARDPKEKRALVAARRSIIDGASFHEAVAGAGLFPPLVVSLLEVGEETGRLPELARRAAILCEEDVKLAVDTASTLVEPLLLAVAGLMTGIAVVTTALPMLSVLGNL